MRLALIGVNHKTAPLDVRERLAFADDRMSETLLALHAFTGADGKRIIDECVVLSTCNRTEFYCVYNCDIFNFPALARFIAERRDLAADDVSPHLYNLSGQAAVKHLFRVASGLESMVIGEHQITGQVKSAYEAAVACHTNGPFTNKLFHLAFRTAKQVRSETKIGVGSTSVSQVACDLAREHYHDLAERRALIVGAGETGALALRHLRERGLSRITILNRTVAKAEALAAEHAAAFGPLGELPRCLATADVVVSATSAPHMVVTEAQLRTAMAGRIDPVHLFDIAVPRDIEPGVRNVRGVTLHDMDDLQAHVERNVERRSEERHAAFKIVENAAEEFVGWHLTNQMTPAITELRNMAESIRAKEIEKLRTHLSEEDYARVEAVTRTIMNKMLHQPIVTLKQAAMTQDGQQVETVLRAMMGAGG